MITNRKKSSAGNGNYQSAKTTIRAGWLRLLRASTTRLQQQQIQREQHQQHEPVQIRVANLIADFLMQ
jgi:hypothetical protein